jgi:hypothetical protein
MKITNGSKTYDVSSWNEEKVTNYLNSGWTKEGGKSEKSQSKKKDKQPTEETVEETVSEPIEIIKEI